MEHTYNDGERRHFSYGAYEASEEEAHRAAEEAQFDASWQQQSGSYPTSARVVSRQVTYTEWHTN